MSRSRQTIQPPSCQPPGLVIVIVIVRAVVFVIAATFVLDLLHSGQDLGTACSSAAGLVTAAVAAARLLVGRAGVDVAVRWQR